MSLIRGVVIKGFLIIDKWVIIFVIFRNDININSWKVAHWVDQDTGENVKLVASVLSIGSPNPVQFFVLLIFATKMHFEVLIDSRKELGFETKL